MQKRKEPNLRWLRAVALSVVVAVSAVSVAQPIGEPERPPVAPPAQVEPAKPEPKAPEMRDPIGPDGKSLIQRMDHRVGTPGGSLEPKGDLKPGIAGPFDGQVVPKRHVSRFGEKGEKVAINYLSGEFVPPAGQKIQPEIYRLAASRMGSGVQSGVVPVVHGMILLNGWMTDELREWLANQGVTVFNYYPYSAYTASIPANRLETIASRNEVRWVGMPNAVQKLEPLLAPFMNQATTAKRSLYLNLFGPDTEGAFKAFMQANGITVGSYEKGLFSYYIEADSATVARLLEMDSVLYIEQVPVHSVQHTESMASISADRLWGSYDGNHTSLPLVKIGVMDTGWNAAHQDWTNIVGGTAGYNHTTDPDIWNDAHGHGSHVSGTFFGEGVAQSRYRGVAQGRRDSNDPGWDFLLSKVFRSNGFSEGNSVLDGINSQAGSGGAQYTRRIVNYSGGGGGTTSGTSTQSRRLDELFAADMMYVVAAGNSGSGSGTVLIPGDSKGAITVGSVYDNGTSTDVVYPSSSRGPTADGRVKPDVAAPGAFIDSVGNNGSTTGYNTGWTGTSMATPHVAGLLTGLVQHYAGSGGPSWFYKTLIMATAIANSGSRNNNYGAGKVDGMLAHYGMDGGWQAWWGTNGGAGSMSVRDFTLGAPVARLVVVMTYPDPPAAGGAGSARVNDIDLWLQHGTLTTDRSGQWASRSSFDTVEYIVVNNAPAGNYRIKIDTWSMASGGSQNWAVTYKVIAGAPTENYALQVNYPVAYPPNADFNINATAIASSHVASGVYADFDLLTGGTVYNGLTYNRQSPSGSNESYWFAGVDAMNMGNAHASGWNRTMNFSMRGTTEGVKNFRVTTTSSNGGTRQANASVIIDGTPPTNWGSPLPTPWANSLTPTCSVVVQDVLSGLNTTALYYWYWNGSTWVGPTNCTTGAGMGSTALERIYANTVPFGSEGTHWLYFRAYDRAGNWSDMPNVQFNIDATQPIFTTYTPSATVFGNRVTVVASCQDVLSGLRRASAWYRYSTDGGATWSAWVNTVTTGADGTTAVETITAPNIPFPNASATNNLMQFYVEDMAGNARYSDPMVIRTTSAFTLVDGGAEYSESSAFGSGNRHNFVGLANFRPSGSVGDQLFQNWWFYRVQGNNREYGIGSNLIYWDQPAPNRMLLVYDEPDDEGSTRIIRFWLDYNLFKTEGDTAILQIDHYIENLTGVTRTVHFYNYTDFDLSGTAGGDSAANIAPGVLRQTEGSLFATLTARPHPNFWEIAPFASLRTKLLNTSADTLANATSPSMNFDATLGFQWSYNNIPTGNYVAGTMWKTIGRPVIWGDINNDGCVDDVDLAIVLSQFGASAYGLAADVNADGVVDDVDLAIVLSYFGTGC
ncbi:MAG: S8 family serine peptidase [Armatimonadetes bacterium]|nr:S8 family serine peptidase [Armatimonadota bacterium]